MTAPARWLIAVCENPPADGMARKNDAGDARHPLAASSWSLSIGGSALAAHGLADRRRLEEAHDGDGEGARQEAADVVERRRDRRRQARRHGSDEGDAVLVDRRHGDEGDAERHGDEWARHRGAKRRRPRSTAIVSAEKAAVVQLMSPRSSTIPRTSPTTSSASGRR